MIKKILFAISVLFFPLMVIANDGPEPPDTITSIGISEKVAEHYLDYSHFEIIGACVWLKCSWYGCSTRTKLELDEYIPDLVVTAYNGEGNDPWVEADLTLDAASHATANVATQMYTGQTLTNGRNRMVSRSMHADSQIIKSVDVIGNPFTLLEYPFPTLEVDTSPFAPYYQSDLDVLMDRSGLAEGIRWETFTPLVNTIGSPEYHWGYEFPRSMTQRTSNDYKAAVMAALHGADIATNDNTLHVMPPYSISNSCGKNCAVSNVIEETEDDHEIWQEVYPNDRHIHPGENDVATVGDLGAGDDADGNGNYVFVVWRHYRGCQQGPGDLIYATTHVSETEKR